MRETYNGHAPTTVMNDLQINFLILRIWRVALLGLLFASREPITCPKDRSLDSFFFFCAMWLYGVYRKMPYEYHFHRNYYLSIKLISRNKFYRSTVKKCFFHFYNRKCRHFENSNTLRSLSRQLHNK